MVPAICFVKYMELIKALIKNGYLRTPEIILAFKKINRLDFVREEDKQEAEINLPLPIGHGQTVSQPATVAFMIELLGPRPGQKIMDVGSGSGWTTALLSEIAGPDGKVFGIELLADLKDFGEHNVARYNFIKKGIAVMIRGDGYEGLPEYAPFDKILVSAAAPEIPEKLLKQLKIGGRMVIPIGERFQTQELAVIDKIGEDEYEEKKFPGYIFVPLVKK